MQPETGFLLHCTPLLPPALLPHTGAHELQAAEESGLVAPSHPAATTLAAVLTDFLGQDVAHTCGPPHVAVCGNATDRWLYTGVRCVSASSA